MCVEREAERKGGRCGLQGHRFTWGLCLGLYPPPRAHTHAVTHLHLLYSTLADPLHTLLQDLQRHPAGAADHRQQQGEAGGPAALPCARGQDAAGPPLLPADLRTGSNKEEKEEDLLRFLLRAAGAPLRPADWKDAGIIGLGTRPGKWGELSGETIRALREVRDGFARAATRRPAPWRKNTCCYAAQKMLPVRPAF